MSAKKNRSNLNQNETLDLVHLTQVSNMLVYIFFIVLLVFAFKLLLFCLRTSFVIFKTTAADAIINFMLQNKQKNDNFVENKI